MVDRGARARGADGTRHPVRVSRPFDHRLGILVPILENASMPFPGPPDSFFGPFLPAFDEVRHMVQTRKNSALENGGVGRSTGHRSEEACVP